MTQDAVGLYGPCTPLVHEFSSEWPHLAIPDDLFGLVKALCGIEIILAASTGVVVPIPDPALLRGVLNYLSEIGS